MRPPALCAAWLVPGFRPGSSFLALIAASSCLEAASSSQLPLRTETALRHVTCRPGSSSAANEVRGSVPLEVACWPCQRRSPAPGAAGRHRRSRQALSFSPHLSAPQLLDLLFAEHPVSHWTEACLTRRAEILERLRRKSDAPDQQRLLTQDSTRLRETLLHCLHHVQYHDLCNDIKKVYIDAGSSVAHTGDISIRSWTPQRGGELLKALAQTSDSFYFFMKCNALFDQDPDEPFPPSLQLEAILADLFREGFPDTLRACKPIDPLLASAIQDSWQRAVEELFPGGGNNELYHPILRLVMDYAIAPRLEWRLDKASLYKWLQARHFRVDASLLRFLQACQPEELEAWMVGSAISQSVEHQQPWLWQLCRENPIPPPEHPLWLAEAHREAVAWRRWCGGAKQKPLAKGDWQSAYYASHLLLGCVNLLLFAKAYPRAEDPQENMQSLFLLLPCYLSLPIVLLNWERGFAFLYTSEGYPTPPCLEMGCCHSSPVLPVCLFLLQASLLLMPPGIALGAWMLSCAR